LKRLLCGSLGHPGKFSIGARIFLAGDRSGRPGEAVLAVPVNRAKGSDRRTVAVMLTVLPAWAEAAGDE
jgi:hypothetical protein